MKNILTIIVLFSLPTNFKKNYLDTCEFDASI